MDRKFLTMQSLFRWMIGVLAVASLLAARQARGEASRVPGVIAVGGDAEERDLEAIRAGLAAATHAAGWQLPSKPITKRELAGLLRCLDVGEPWECIPAPLTARGIRHALGVAAKKQQAENGSPVVVFTVSLIATSPRALLVRQRFCEHCSEDKLTQAATEVTQQLLEELAVRTGRTILAVKSMPSGARIVLDGASIGATDATFNTYPGLHTVILEKPGYLTQTVSVEAAEGKTAEVSVVLRESPPTAPTETLTSSPPTRWVPLALMGVGAASMGAAGALLYVGERDGSDDKKLRPRATTVGAVVGIAGAATLGVGLYLWLRGPRPSGPTASALPDGLAVGWIEAF
jgi:PEGA domain